MRFGKSTRRTGRCRIYYTGDIHGSDICFRKFLNAAAAYDAQVLVLGGDLTGKGVLPIVLSPAGSYKSTFLGEEVELLDEEAVVKFEHRIRFNGLYPLRVSAEEQVRLGASRELRSETFTRLLREQLRSWMSLADERLGDSSVVCAVMLGNDDDPGLEAEIEASAVVVNPEGQPVDLGAGYVMVSSGYSNITPWKSPRELPEDRLAEQLDEFAAATVADAGGRMVFNFHCPPYDSGLDTAQQLDSDLRPVFEGANPLMVPVGSTAVREAIERYQPAVSLHGHIHEARAARRIGRTLAINPGSDYSSGQLQGVIVDLDDEGVVDYVLTRG
jgi:Icc-related predicted phosphoesterase